MPDKNQPLVQQLRGRLIRELALIEQTVAEVRSLDLGNVPERVVAYHTLLLGGLPQLIAATRTPVVQGSDTRMSDAEAVEACRAFTDMLFEVATMAGRLDALNTIVTSFKGE